MINKFDWCFHQIGHISFCKNAFWSVIAHYPILLLDLLRSKFNVIACVKIEIQTLSIHNELDSLLNQNVMNLTSTT